MISFRNIALLENEVLLTCTSNFYNMYKLKYDCSFLYKLCPLCLKSFPTSIRGKNQLYCNKCKQNFDFCIHADFKKTNFIFYRCSGCKKYIKISKVAFHIFYCPYSYTNKKKIKMLKFFKKSLHK